MTENNQSRSSQSDDKAIEERLTKAFERVASTAERVGIPAATFAAGAIALFLSTRSQIQVLPWVGAALILGALGVYAWLTARSTVKVEPPPRPIAQEVTIELEWLRSEIAKNNKWLREQLSLSDKKDSGSEKDSKS